MNTKYIPLLLSALAFPLTTALAAGIQVSPAKLEFNISDGKPASATIVVANPTANVQLFEISADDFQSAISANPESVTLEAGTRKTIIITVAPKDLPQNGSQLLGTNLSVISRPLAASELGVGAGVKLPVTIAFFPAPKNNLTPIILYAAAALVLAILIIFWFAKKRP